MWPWSWSVFLHPKKKKTRGVNPNWEEEDQRPSAGREGEEEEEKALPCVSELSHAHQCKLKEREKRHFWTRENFVWNKIDGGFLLEVVRKEPSLLAKISGGLGAAVCV